jgi:CDP-diacylglycerol--glycerol-3-phosphate 3-phosphatidyltransferase/cardiolipin synthase
VAFAVMLAAVLITVWTGVEYVVQALKVRSEGLRRRAADQDNPNQDIPNQEGQP